MDELILVNYFFGIDVEIIEKISIKDIEINIRKHILPTKNYFNNKYFWIWINVSDKHYSWVIPRCVSFNSINLLEKITLATKSTNFNCFLLYNTIRYIKLMDYYATDMKDNLSFDSLSSYILELK